MALTLVNIFQTLKRQAAQAGEVDEMEFIEEVSFPLATYIIFVYFYDSLVVLI